MGSEGTAEMSSPAPDSVPSEPATVLVVEDEPLLLEVYVDWLDEYYDVIPADGGEAGLEKIHNDVDVAVVDRRMPDVNGDSVIRRIRDRGIDCQIAVVSAVEPTVELLDIPLDDYLVKPVILDDLTAAIERLLDRAAYSDTAREAFRLASKVETLHHYVPNDAWLENERLIECLERFDAHLDRADDEVRARIAAQYDGYPFDRVIDQGG